MKEFITINETEYEMVWGNFRWEKKKGLETQVVQSDVASPYQIAENYSVINLEQETIIYIEKNPNISVYLWNENGREKEINLKTNQFSAPSSKGQHIYEVFAKWRNILHIYSRSGIIVFNINNKDEAKWFILLHLFFRVTLKCPLFRWTKLF